MRFTTTTLLTLTASIAVLLSVLLAIERGNRPDPRSEYFSVHGVEYSPDWTECKWLPTRSGVTGEPFVISQNYRGDCVTKIRQKLFAYGYDDNFGNATFDIDYEIDAIFNGDWSEHVVSPIINGGGNTGANASINTTFDVENRLITVTIQQRFNFPAEAKQTTLNFFWDGVRFQIRNEE